MQEAGSKDAIFGKTRAQFVCAGSTLGVIARRWQRHVVVRLLKQARHSELREPVGITVSSLPREAEQDEWVVRKSGARFTQGAGFRLLIRPVEHSTDVPPDEIGDRDLRGGMNATRERVAPPPEQQSIHACRRLEVFA